LLYEEGAHRAASKGAIKSSSSSSSPVIPLGDHLLTNTGLISWVGVLVCVTSGSLIVMSRLAIVFKTECLYRPQSTDTEMFSSDMLRK
jgi:hypothetical protein